MERSDLDTPLVVRHRKRPSPYVTLGVTQFVATEAVRDGDRIFTKEGRLATTSLHEDDMPISTVQCTGKLEPGTEVVIYQNLSDKQIWVRPVSEFIDGRFVIISQDPWTPPCPKSPCVGICRVHENVCIGCGRTLQQIADYGNSIREKKVSEETVTILKSEYDVLFRAASVLSALEEHGVDHWEWYGEALASLEGK